MNGGTVVALLVVAILAGAGAGYYAGSRSQVTSTSVSTTTLTTTLTSASISSEPQGVVTGSVSVGGETPSNISLYSIVFDQLLCSGGSCQHGQGSLAPIYPSGHYSVILAPGNYSLSLYPVCEWHGCATAFQEPVTVVGGQQIVVNVDIPSP